MGRLNTRELQLLSELESVQRGMQQRETLVGELRSSFWYKCRYLTRPVEIVLGCIALLLSLLIWVSLLLTNIDKALNSSGLKMGFVLSKRTLFNPLDYVLVYLQAVFPLDYVLFLAIAWFLILCTFSGIRNLGVRIFFIRMYRLRTKRTVPQGMLLTCAILMLTTLAINILFFCISPEYVTFGNQNFINHTNSTQKSTNVHLPVVDQRSFELPPTVYHDENGNYTVIQCNNQADEGKFVTLKSSYE
jgi:LMBR1 domain-containing protein 1